MLKLLETTWNSPERRENSPETVWKLSESTWKPLGKNGFDSFWLMGQFLGAAGVSAGHFENMFYSRCFNKIWFHLQGWEGGQAFWTVCPLVAPDHSLLFSLLLCVKKSNGFTVTRIAVSHSFLSIFERDGIWIRSGMEQNNMIRIICWHSLK